MFSEMSFKCRSTTSFASSSYTLTDPNSDLTRPEKAYGLGIYAPKKRNASSSSASASSFSTAASFLTPRPSLKTLRTHASLAGPQPLHLHSKSYPTTSSAHSPLPPVPTYNPEKYKNFPPLQHLHSYKKSYSSSGPPPPPRRAYTLKRRGSQGTLRVVLRSPSCPMMLGEHREDIFDEKVIVKVKAEEDSKPSNAIINKSLVRTLSLGAESISSVYSRSLSGEDPEPTANIAPRTTSIPATTTTNNRYQPRPYHQHQLPGIPNPHTATSSLPKIPPQNPQYRPFRPARPSSGPAPGPRPQSGARPPPIRYHHHNPSHHYQQQQHQHQHQHQPGNNNNGNNNRILVRNHFPGPGHDPKHHQRGRKTASAEEVRSGGRLTGPGHDPRHHQRNRKAASAEEIRCRNSRLPVARAVSGFGDVRDWSHGGGHGGFVSGEMVVGGGWAARCGLPPLPVDRAVARFREV
jgi:hypothetical protein